MEKIAAERGEDPLSTLYDLMLEHDATSMLMLPFYNYAYGNHDAIREMLTHPAGVVGLSDGGAHCGMICDASFPTFLLTHWARDRHRGEKLPLEYVIRKQSYDTAQLFGLSDRGVVEIGKRADVNVIDMDAITLHRPQMAYDLPAGGKRLIQGASGYDATIVNGVVTRRARRRHRRAARPVGPRGALATATITSVTAVSAGWCVRCAHLQRKLRACCPRRQLLSAPRGGQIAHRSRLASIRGLAVEGLVDQRLGCRAAYAHGDESSSEVASAAAPS